MRIGIFLALAVLGWGPSALADVVNNEWYSTPAALGMGNTGIASSDDPTTAMFYNPAGLAKQRKPGVELLNFHVEFGTGNFTLTPNITEFGKHLSLGQIQPKLSENRFTTSSLGVSTYPTFYTQNFGFGVLGRSETYSYMDNAGQVIYRSRYLLVPTGALSMGINGGRFRIGVAIRGVQVTESSATTADLTNLSYKNSAMEGMGLAADAGLIWTFLTNGFGSLGLVARNIGDTALNTAPMVKMGTGDSTGHAPVKRTYDAGISLSPRYGQRTFGIWSVDYRDAFNVTNTKVASKFNFGTELNLDRFFYLRAGISRGYYTAGFGIQGKRAFMDIGTYGEEMSTGSFRLTEDRRIFLRVGGKL